MWKSGRRRAPEVALAVGSRPISDGCLAAYSGQADHDSGMMPNRATAPRTIVRTYTATAAMAPRCGASSVGGHGSRMGGDGGRDDHLELCRAIRETLLPPRSEPASGGLSKGWAKRAVQMVIPLDLAGARAARQKEILLATREGDEGRGHCCLLECPGWSCPAS